MNRPILPTQEQFAEWDSEYFDGERQNFDVMMIKAFQAGADWQLERDAEHFAKYLVKHFGLAPEIADLRAEWFKEEMRPQEDNS